MQARGTPAFAFVTKAEWRDRHWPAGPMEGGAGGEFSRPRVKKGVQKPEKGTRSFLGSCIGQSLPDWLLTWDAEAPPPQVVCIGLRNAHTAPLNTVPSLGGSWPATAALWLVGLLTMKECPGAQGHRCGVTAAAGSGFPYHCIIS